ncbi:MAG: MFS transporter [Spirochaetales bacterium]|nr:MFS transporter [Spirochaetales bacterium]
MTTLTPTLDVKDKIRRSLVFSIYDGIAFSIMFGMSDSFFQPFGKFLGADIIVLGLIRSLPIAVGSVSQLFAGQLAAIFKSRRRFISLFALLHALMFIPVFLCWFLGEGRVAVLILFVIIANVFFMLPIPLWSSWMGDLMDEKTRGSYLGRRSSLSSVGTFPSMLAAGFILDEMKSLGRPYLGFVVIFSVAFVARSISAWFLSRKYDPPYDYEARRSLSVRDFVSNAKKTNIGSFILYMSLLNFAMSMIASYVDPFLLFSVNVGYLPWTALTATLLAVKFLFMPLWGRACDRYGTRKVLLVSSAIIGVIPLLWYWGYLLPFAFFIQAAAGFGWAGFEISTFNFLFDNTSIGNRVSTVSIYSMTNGLMTLAGSLVAGALVAWAGTWPGVPATTSWLVGRFTFLPERFLWSPYLVIFLVSGVMRLSLTVVFSRFLKETRPVRHIRAYHLPLRIISMMPTRGIVARISILARIAWRKRAVKTANSGEGGEGADGDHGRGDVR